jgi:hypothetical protein
VTRRRAADDPPLLLLLRHRIPKRRDWAMMIRVMLMMSTLMLLLLMLLMLTDFACVWRCNWEGMDIYCDGIDIDSARPLSAIGSPWRFVEIGAKWREEE